MKEDETNKEVADVLHSIADILSGKVSRDKSFEVSKLDLFGGTADLEAWGRIEEYLSTGKTAALSRKESVYLDFLMLIHSMDWKYGKRVTMRFLTSEPVGLPYDRAAAMYAESTELFYSDRNYTKEALRRKTADQFDALYVAARDAAVSAKDYKAAAEILKMKADVLQLDVDERPAIDPNLYRPDFRVLSPNPEDIGLPRADRRKIDEQIRQALPDGMSDLERIQVEAGIKDLDLEQFLKNEQSEES